MSAALSPAVAASASAPQEAALFHRGETNELDEERWQPLMHLPCDLTVDLLVPDFRAADLLQLQLGSIVGTGWQIVRDVPLRVNGTLIGWSEFEVVGNRLAVRLTELA